MSVFTTNIQTVNPAKAGIQSLLKPHLILYVLLLLLTACGSNPNISPESGAVNFNIKLSRPLTANLNAYLTGNNICSDYGIETISAAVLNSSSDIVTSVSWSCSAHEGTITGVPAGSNYTVRLNGIDSNNSIMWRGEKSGIDIISGATAVAGAIIMTYIGSDATAPTVTSTSPSNNSTNVPVTTALTATFSEKMALSSINISTFTVSNGSTSVSGSVTYDPDTMEATFIPSGSLSYSTTYTATITTDVEDMASNRMQTDYSWSFTMVASPWSTTTIDGIGNAKAGISIAIDSNNKIHISYVDDTDDDLKYATNASGSWATATVDSTFILGSSSIAIDYNNKVHISYIDAANYDLKYATNASGSWTISTIDSEGMVGYSSSIAIDSNNKVHISYYDYFNSDIITGDLKYATNASGSWVTSTVDSIGVAGRETSIAMDSNNKIHIAYLDDANGDLKYATNTSGSWVTLTLDDSIGRVGFSPSIAIDTSNNVHISYHDETQSYLKYVTNTSGSWVISSIDNGGDYTSLAVDSNAKVHISYSDVTTHGLQYATNVSGTWVTYTIDSAGTVGEYHSIAIDSNNKVHIVYSHNDYPNGALKYATNQ